MRLPRNSPQLRRILSVALSVIALSASAMLVLGRTPPDGTSPTGSSSRLPGGARSPDASPTGRASTFEPVVASPSASPKGSSESTSPRRDRLDGAFVAHVTLSGDGSLLAFAYDKLKPQRLYYRDRIAGRVTEFMRAPDGRPPNGEGRKPVVSANGNRIAFESSASNLTERPDDNGAADIFVYDVASTRITLVSVTDGGDQANGHSRNPSLSADGRYVAFESDASNLVGGDDNGDTNVFVRDLAGRTTKVVAVQRAGAPGSERGYGKSSRPSLSEDGEKVAFLAEETAVLNDTTTSAFVRNLRTGETTRVPLPEPESASARATYVAISPEGRFVAVAYCHLPPDPPSGCRTYVHDLQGGRTTVEDSADNASRTDEILYLALSRNGQILIRVNYEASGDGFCAVRDRFSGQEFGFVGSVHGISEGARFVSAQQEPSLGGILEPVIYDRLRGTWTRTLVW